jgi:hypothetical protein
MQTSVSHPGLKASGSTPAGIIPWGLGLLSAATLAFEITLTRLFSVTQFYHFAFMIVSIALLGFGASGTALAIFPNLSRRDPRRSLGILALGAALSLAGAFLLTNWLPFDSFSIAWDRRQALILVLHYLALATPFFFSGMAVGLLLAAFPRSAGRTYAVNLLGSALGCGIGLIAPGSLGGEGTVVLSCGLASLGALLCLGKHVPGSSRSMAVRIIPAAMAGLLLIPVLFDLGLRLTSHRGLPQLELHLSPYKSLSYTLQQPGAQVVYSRWNAFSRVDRVRSASIHSIPGLSYRYLQPLPQTAGLFVDGDDLSPILSQDANPAFTDYLPSAVAFRLRPAASVLVLEPRGGLDIFSALALGAQTVTAVEANPLVVDAVGFPYSDRRVQVVLESDRSYLRRTGNQFDIVVLSLSASYHPVRSGAYSLAEDYRITVESFQDAFRHLKPGGLLVVTRWLQDPPSEELRTFALVVTALERDGSDPGTQIVALRGYNTATILARNGAFPADELEAIRTFAAGRAFDLIYAPGLRLEDTNRYNILPESIYYQTFTGLLNASPRQTFYAAYPYDITPPTDDHPFFGHYFKWSQAGQVLAELGHTWQPFGGAGYFVLLILLLLASLLAGILILLPLAGRRLRRERPAGRSGEAHSMHVFPLLSPLFYFVLIGLAYLLVEIPLIQHFILYLGHPAYAMTAVLFTLLLFSAAGSALSNRLPHPLALGALALLLLGVPLLLPTLFAHTLGLPLPFRLVLTVVVLAPIGFLMGIPFPAGIRWLAEGRGQSGAETPAGNSQEATRIAWVWAANGASSVVASILAALLALSFGYNWVLRAGALCYAGACLTIMASVWHLRSRFRRR